MDVDDTRAAQRHGGGARGALTWLVIVALIAALGWLLSERNARQWTLASEEGRLVVKRGVFFPVGRQAFRTSDPVLAQAYAPIVPPPGARPAEERSFDDRGGLDQALFDLLAGWAKEDVGSGEPARLERGLGYLSRAERLAGISAAQRDELASLRAESAYYEGQRLLARAADELREAQDKLRLAAGARSPRGADAQVLLRQLEPAVDAALAAVRAAPIVAKPKAEAEQRPPDAAPPVPPPAEAK